VLWFTVWTVLVVGTVAGGFLLDREVYRSGRRLVDELDRASATFDTLSQRVEALAGTWSTPAPVDLLDPGPARERMAQVRARQAARRARRAERHARTYRRWQSFVR
jgi:hypothetical protein